MSVHSLVSLSPARTAALAALGRPELVPARVVAAAAGRWRVLTSHGELLAEPTGRLRFDADGQLLRAAHACTGGAP